MESAGRAERALEDLKRSETLALENARRAELALADLKATAPTFEAQARSLLEDGNFDGAVEKIGFAIQLDSSNPGYRLVRANLLEATQRLGDAAEEYRRILALRPGDAVAKANLELCERLLTENGGAPALRKDLQKRLLDSLREQDRLIEAGQLNALFEPDFAIARATLDARLKEYSTQAGWKDMGRVTRLPNNSFRLNLTHLKLGDLSILRGIPISELNLFGPAEGRDADALPPLLKGLAGLPLKSLDISGWVALKDLSPLRGLPLESLKLANTKVADLAPLAGMRLRVLDIGHTPISDLAPLAGMPLEHLDIRYTRVADLIPLRGAPLKGLNIWQSHVVDISPLAGAPLEELALLQTDVADIAPLANCPTLKVLSIYGTKVSDLTPLGKLKLVDLACHWCKVTNIEPLRGQPLRSINLGGLRVTDVSPLADCPTLESVALNTAAKNVEVLRKLTRLKLISTRLSGWGPAQTAAEFWKEYDAKRAGGTK